MSFCVKMSCSMIVSIFYTTITYKFLIYFFTIIFSIFCFVYLFLQYYLDNVLRHEFFVLLYVLLQVYMVSLYLMRASINHNNIVLVLPILSYFHKEILLLLQIPIFPITILTYKFIHFIIIFYTIFIITRIFMIFFPLYFVV